MKSQTVYPYDLRRTGGAGRSILAGAVRTAALALLAWALMTGPALAHKVSLFAWVENGTVFTESKFSGGRAPKDSRVVVYDLTGNQLLEGATDAEGRFAFPAPAAAGIRITLAAGQGHLAEWTVSAEEMAAADTPPTRERAPAANTAGAAASVPGANAGRVSETSRLTVDDIRRAVEEPLARELQGLRAEVRRLRQEIDRGPALTDILGGIGYIFGLVGMAAYFKTRRPVSGGRRS